METLEELSGRGEVYHMDASLGPVGYWIRVEQEVRDSGSFGDSTGSYRGMKDARGRIEAAPSKLLELAGYSARNALLTLHLEDGRRWDFSVEPDGQAANRGPGLYKPEEGR